MDNNDVPTKPAPAKSTKPADNNLDNNSVPQTGGSCSREQKMQRYWNIIRQKLVEKKEDQKTIQDYQRILIRSMQDERLDRALGAIYGAMIGDALGAYCQFFHHLENETVEEAMQMNGGGTFGLEAGQFTDDSELASHLLAGLGRFNEKRNLTGQSKRLVCNIALQYLKWYKSGPFDIGNTTRGGMAAIEDYQQEMKQSADQPDSNPTFLTPFYKVVYSRNCNSIANGSLMRISPFSFFFGMTGENPLEHGQFIKDEIGLTHPNQNLEMAGVCWVSLETDLINRTDNSPATFAKILQKHISNPEFKGIESWFKEAELPKESAMSGTVNMGFAKIAFSYGLRVLHYLAEGKETNLDERMYNEWMYWIIKRAGDTDTNGAIAGGMMGSVVGFWNLPTRYVVRSLKTVTDGRKLQIKDSQPHAKNPSKNKYQTPRRPDFYQPCNVFLSALSMVQRCDVYRQKFKSNTNE